MSYSSTSPLPPCANPTRVLYVEDNTPLRTLIVERMRQAGYEVDGAEDGLEGWGKFCGASYHLIVTDLRMPHLDGIAFIHRVRESQRPVRIIVYSSDLSEPKLAAAYELGVNALVPKQGNWEMLREVMARVMREFGSH